MTVPHSLRTKLAENQELSRQKVRKRLDLGTERPDFMDAMIRKSKALDLPISFEKLTSNAFILIIAGSETTATLMSAATYFLATHPECLAKLKDEVRSAFQSEDQIDMISAQALKYLSAVLDESLRLYPPAPGPAPRVISEGDNTISGNFIPEGTNVDIWHWVLYHDPNHFAMVEEFHPERWLGDDPRFALDAKHVFQPFSLGPRNCIGKNLANAEMRMIMARLIWNFDLRPAENLHKWYDDSKVYMLWEKGPVNVYLEPRVEA